MTQDTLTTLRAALVRIADTATTADDFKVVVGLTKLIAAMEKQEPVAELEFYVDEDGPRLAFSPRRYGNLSNGKHLLFTHAQPVEQPLSDKQISTLWDEHIVPVFGKNGINPIVFARAIEQAIRSKQA